MDGLMDGFIQTTTRITITTAHKAAVEQRTTTATLLDENLEPWRKNGGLRVPNPESERPFLVASRDVPHRTSSVQHCCACASVFAGQVECMVRLLSLFPPHSVSTLGSNERNVG